MKFCGHKHKHTYIHFFTSSTERSRNTGMSSVQQTFELFCVYNSVLIAFETSIYYDSNVHFKTMREYDI